MLGSRGKRVLIIVQNLPVPFDRRVWLEATTLQRNGYQVSVICPKLKGFNGSHEILEDVEIFRYRLPVDANSKFGFVVEFIWAWIATAFLSVRVAVRGRGFDVIHACNPPETFWVLGRLWKLSGKKFIFDHHDLSPEMYEAKFGTAKGTILRVLRWLERQSFKTADVVITTNHSHEEIAIRRGAVSPDRVFVVRSGPDLSCLTRYPPDPKWSNGKPHLIAYLGDISPQDGVDGFVRVAAELRKTRSDFHCLILGGGSALESLRSYAVQLGLDDIVTFAGTVSDETLCRALSSATIAVDTVPVNAWSDRSTMNKIMEYMFFGLPIVAFDLQETKRSAGDAVVTVATNSEADFAAAVSALLEDPDKRHKMAEDGRSRLESTLAWHHSVPQLLSAYEAVSANAPEATEHERP